jgi:hypothetical protein
VEWRIEMCGIPKAELATQEERRREAEQKKRREAGQDENRREKMPHG